MRGAKGAESNCPFPVLLVTGKRCTQIASEISERTQPSADQITKSTTVDPEQTGQNHNRSFSLYLTNLALHGAAETLLMAPARRAGLPLFTACPRVTCFNARLLVETDDSSSLFGSPPFKCCPGLVRSACLLDCNGREIFSALLLERSNVLLAMHCDQVRGCLDFGAGLQCRLYCPQFPDKSINILILRS